MITTADELGTLIRSLQDPALYEHEVRHFEVIETHISWVLLTGPFAYKIKKPVDLGFVDFSTLEKRRFYCGEELRLNRRLAPRLYVDLVAITGTPTAPALNGTGNAIEYAVKMIQFPQDAQLDRVLARGALESRHIDKLARVVAAFHASIAVASPTSPFGDPPNIHRLVQANFQRVLTEFHEEPDVRRLRALSAWSQQEYDRQQKVFWQRKRDGFVRECHGDMHLRNMALLDNELLIFDCIEFSEEIRWIDIISEAAFVVMDLDDRGCAPLARRFVNAYLEATGDYDGVKLLHYYLVYRAMVRAMVGSIRAHQADLRPEKKNDVLAEYRGYVGLAERYTRTRAPALIITHGLSGSGKTTAAQALLESYPAIRVRSDVERKRLYGLEPGARTRAEIGAGLYTVEASSRTYERLAELARTIIEAGYSVIVDAAFLKRAERDRFYTLASELRVPFVILDCRAREATLRERVSAREEKGGDASEATIVVLAHQIATHEPLTEAERARAVRIDTARRLRVEQILHALRPYLPDQSGAASEFTYY
jgi:aminoglycoside phosphotransferase family enzyme/predicted kinase